MQKIRYGMVGGGQGALIGGLNRKAAALEGQFDFVAGALSSNPEKSVASGKELGLPNDRNYPDWQSMLAAELALPLERRIQAVVIVTPNHLHYPVAKAFAAAGIHIICDKPLCHTLEQAQDLIRTTRASGVIFAVTHNYTGYPMVRHARDMVRAGTLGQIRKVIVEYHQGWLATALEGTGHKQADWRVDPARSGLVGAMGDIGSHAENLIHTITGLELSHLCADLTAFGTGRMLDDDSSILLRFEGGAKGVLLASQIAIGHENDLRIRVFGDKASLTWHQENPNELIFMPLEGPKQTLSKGSSGLSAAALKASRLPPGHPEAFLEAFANLYVGIAEAIWAKQDGRTLTSLEGDFPTLQDGARGMHFLEKTVESAGSEVKWLEAKYQPI